MKETIGISVRALGWENPLEKGMALTPIFLPGESRGQRSLAGYGPQGRTELYTSEVTCMYAQPWIWSITGIPCFFCMFL